MNAERGPAASLQDSEAERAIGTCTHVLLVIACHDADALAATSYLAILLAIQKSVHHASAACMPTAAGT